MADPWEKYAKKPWEKYKPSDAPRTPEMAGGMAALSSLSRPTMPEPAAQSSGAAFAGNLLPGLTVGLADEMAAGIGSVFEDRSYDEILTGLRRQQAQQRKDSPIASLAGEVVGALALPLGGLKSTGKRGLDAVKGIGTGATLSGLYGFGSGEGGFQERVKSGGNAAMIGALLGGLIPGAGAVVQKLANRNATSKAIADGVRSAPSGDQLRANAGAIFKRADDSGVNLSSPAFAQKIQDAVTGAQRSGMSPANGMLAPTAPKSLTAATAMEDVATRPQGFGFREMDTARNMAQAAAGSADKFDAQIGTGLMKGIDEAFGATTPKMAAEVKDARDMWGRLRRSEKIEEAMRKAELHPSGFAQGIMTEVRGILRDPKKLRGFSDMEKEAMKRLTSRISPTSVLNVLGKMGPRLTGNGNIMGTAISTGGSAALLGPWAALAGPAIGMGARVLGDRASAQKAEIVRALIANGGIKGLPQASQLPREITEKLLQRGTAAAQQP